MKGSEQLKKSREMTNDYIVARAGRMTTFELSSVIGDLERELFTLSSERLASEIQRNRKNQITHRLILLKPLLKKRQSRMEGF